MKKGVRITGICAIGLGVLAGAVVLYVILVVGAEGSSALERWAAEQLRSVANGYLEPELVFDQPDYQYPKTFVVENVRLIAQDPANPGQTVDILRVGRATLRVGAIPEVGKPLQIEQVILERPELRLIAAGADSAQLIGFANLLKESIIQKPTTKEKAKQKDQSSEADATKITDVFRIHSIHITDGLIVYDPRRNDQPAMRLDKLNTQLDVESADDGWYALSATVMRKPILNVALRGRLNLDDATMQVDTFKLTTHVGGQQNASLPPQLQAVLDQYDVRGKLSATANGMLAFNELQKSTLDAHVTLDDGHLALNGYQVQIDHLSAEATLAEQQLTIPHVEVEALRGTLEASALVGLQAGRNVRVTANARNLHIQDVLRIVGDRAPANETIRPETEPAGSAASSANASQADGVRPETDRPQPSDNSATTESLPFRGQLDFQFDLSAPADAITTEASGKGRLKLVDGRLLRLPVIGEIEEQLAKVTNITGKPDPAASEQALIEFELKGDRAHLTKIDFRAALVAVRGSGHVHLDGKLDLSLNGGPIEKVQSLLGPFGDLTALITDNLAKYKVTGTLDDPKVSLQLGGDLFAPKKK